MTLTQTTDNNKEVPAKLNLIPYNTGMKKLALPEYGRAIHELAEKCVAIEDRNERTAFAYAIVDVMHTLMQNEDGDQEDKKYWDHLFLMTDFKLDIDSPYPIPAKEEMTAQPKKIPYSSSQFGRRHYGKTIQRLISTIADMENGEEKDVLVEMVANHLKKIQTLQNNEGVDNTKVFKDLEEFSGGRIVLSADTYPLAEFREDNKEHTSAKKKKK